MDPLGRCFTVILIDLIFVILCAFFSSSAAMLSTLRAPDEDDESEYGALINKLYAGKNALRYRLLAAAAVCAMVCAGVSAYCFYAPFADSLKALPPFLSALLLVWAVSLPVVSLGILIPTAVAERLTIPPALYSLVRFALITSYIFAFPPILISALVLKIFRIEPDTSRSDVTEQEILQLVDEGESSGAINSEEREMIENIFDFSEHAVREVMTHYKDVTAIKDTSTDSDIFEIICDTGYSRYPVYGDDVTDITGMLIAKEYLCDRLSPAPRELSQLIREPLFVPDTMLTDAVLRTMNTSSIHMAIVVNEYGEACGIVTMEDLLEEIVGKIYDETDTADDRDPEMEKLDEGVYHIHATCALDDFEDFAQVDLIEKDGIDTIGALLFSKLKTIPDDAVPIDVETEHLLLHSDGLKERRLEWVTVRVKETEEEDD